MKFFQFNAGGGVQATVLAIAGVLAPQAAAQEHVPGKVDVAWNRYYDHTETNAIMNQIAEAYPGICRIEKIGTSGQGRDMLVAIVNNPETGPDTDKPGMWIDGNVHGNEIQASEVVLYSLWYLTKMYGVNEDITQLLDDYSFYLLPVVNPDGRQHWFDEPNTPSSSRQNQRPLDNDNDGLIDEDPYDDLDGDGSITRMWKEDPDGDWIRDKIDPRIFRRVGAEEEGEWRRLGQEGIDNDGDGRTNEDGPFADDMNRNWPADWRPTYIQGGAGKYPFSAPEAAAVGRFLLDRANVAAVQSYHNTGGMMLRGPGVEYRQSMYPARDRRVYDEMGRIGEEILPYYRYLVLFKDLYGVHGGFVTWTAEGLGVFSFTNELWTSEKYFQRDVRFPDEEQQWIWRDRLAFGQVFKDYTEVDHPEHGKVLVGGTNKWASRSTPTFMLEEECHRNFAFTAFHADSMPLLKFARTDIEKTGANLWAVTIEIENTKLIPTRSGVQQAHNIGRNDLLHCNTSQGTEIVIVGRINQMRDKTLRPIRHEPERIQVPEGIPSKGSRMFRYILSGREGADVEFVYKAEKAMDIRVKVKLAETPDPKG